MLGNRSPTPGERVPDQFLLSKELQYKIIASSALLEMMIRMSEPYMKDPEKRVPPGDPEIIVAMGRLAASDDPFKIEPYIQNAHEAAKRNMANITKAVDPTKHQTSAVRRISTELQIIDDSLQLTGRFGTAVGLRTRKTNESWGNLYDSNNMVRLNSAKGEVLKYFTPRLTPLTADGATTTTQLGEFLHEAEFWIGRYDPTRQ